jgi:uncharacterized membrane protein SpoIIM required for sporulation
VIHYERLFAESKFCRAMACAAAAEWLVVIWGDSVVEIAATTIAGVCALVLSHHLYWRADVARSIFRTKIAHEEIARVFGGLKA